MKALLALLLLSAVAHADTLDSGLQVIIEPDPTVNSIGIYVRHDDCAAALAQPERIDDELDRIDDFATSSFETTHFDAYTQVPAGALELALWFEAKRMRSPTLAPAAPAPDDDYSKIDAAIEAALRPHTTVDKNEAQRCVAPEHTTIAIVGRVDQAVVQKLARKYFAGLARSKFAPREWKSSFTTAQTVTVTGSSFPRKILAWQLSPTFEGTALVLARRLASYGIEIELHEDELRVIHGDLGRVPQLLQSPVDLEKRRVDTELLEKLEPLRYRASLLASGKSIDKLRADIAHVTLDDLKALAAMFVGTTALTVEVTR